MEYGDNDTLATEQHIEDWVMDKERKTIGKL